MGSMLRIAATAMIVAVNATQAQPDGGMAPNQVTSVAVRSGRLALSSAADPGPVFLADGSYTNEAKTVIVVLNGRITNVEYTSGTVVRVASIRLQNDRVMLMPAVTALMSVSPVPLPSGTFTSEDGSAFLRVESARPVAFKLGAGSQP